MPLLHPGGGGIITEMTVHVAHHKQVAHYVIDLNNGLVVNQSGNKRSFCQLLYTIENHCHSIESNGCLSIVHFMVPKFYQRPGLISHIVQNLQQKNVSVDLKSNQRILRAQNVSFDQHMFRISGHFLSKPIAHCAGPF